MGDRVDPKTNRTAGSVRQERLKAALKANMARRKAQGRARQADARTEQDKDAQADTEEG